jgi:hypothetical protein
MLNIGGSILQIYDNKHSEIEEAFVAEKFVKNETMVYHSTSEVVHQLKSWFYKVITSQHQASSQELMSCFTLKLAQFTEAKKQISF